MSAIGFDGASIRFDLVQLCIAIAGFDGQLLRAALDLALLLSESVAIRIDRFAECLEPSRLFRQLRRLGSKLIGRRLDTLFLNRDLLPALLNLGVHAGLLGRTERERRFLGDQSIFSLLETEFFPLVRLPLAGDGQTFCLVNTALGRQDGPVGFQLAAAFRKRTLAYSELIAAGRQHVPIGLALRETRIKLLPLLLKRPLLLIKLLFLGFESDSLMVEPCLFLLPLGRLLFEELKVPHQFGPVGVALLPILSDGNGSRDNLLLLVLQPLGQLVQSPLLDAEDRRVVCQAFLILPECQRLFCDQFSFGPSRRPFGFTLCPFLL